jgi:dynein heavy chain
MDLGNPQLVTKVAQLCVDAHTSVEAAAGRFYQELRRRYYVTPKMFLDLVSLYDSLLRSKQSELEGARARLLCGIQKLQETNAAVDVMTQQLNDLQPLLAEKTGTTQKLLEQVCEGFSSLSCVQQPHARPGVAVSVMTQAPHSTHLTTQCGNLGDGSSSI